MDSDQADSGDKNIAIKIAAAGAAVVVGLGALYLLTRSDPKKSKKKSKKDKERSKSKKDKKKKKADSDEEEEEDGQDRIDWENSRGSGSKPPARKAFDPNAHGIKQDVLSLEDAREWMDNFHETKDFKSAYAALVSLLSDLSTDAASVQETDKAGIMRSDYERWFLTGFIAGVLATNPSMCIPQTLMVLRRMGAKKEDLSEAPMVLYAAMLCSRTKEAMSTAFELWMSSQPEATMKNVKNEKQITQMFEKALTEFSEMTMSYMPLILMGTYYATRNETIIQQAMTTLERFFEALRKARVKEQIEGFYRGTAYALTRFAALGPDFKQFLADYKTDDPTLKKALREALTGVNGGNDFDDLGEEEAPPKRSAAKLRSSGGARAGRASAPDPDPADD